MELLHYPLAFLAALGILVTFHEFGHYLVARWSGVQIVRFSIGFGRPLLSWVDKRGTEFALALIPLGGYVRMLDEDEEFTSASIPAGAKSYKQLSPWWRVAIALGGPFANFVLAIFVYWILLIAGTFNIAPMVAAPDADTPLARAGLSVPSQIVAVDGEPVAGWQDVGLALTERLGETGEIELTVRDLASAREQVLKLPIRDWHVGVGEPDVLGSLGIKQALLSVAGPVMPDSAAQRAGLQEGDFIAAVDGRTVADWDGWVDEIQANAQRQITLSVFREGRALQMRATPDARQLEDGTTVGMLGVAPAQIRREYGVIEAFPFAVAETWDKSVMILSILKKMVVGQVSVKNLSGPISIAQVAGDSARYSWRSFVGIIAFLSISLGIFNLLPVPLLDGGHVLFNAVEIVSGRPVPERVQVVGVQVGLFLVGTMLVFATYNDLLRIF